MGRREILLLIAYIPILVLSLIFSYFGYSLAIKRYRKEFYRALRRNGISRKIATRIVRELKFMTIKEFLRHGNMRNIW
ncbi:hypothetical protein AciM339_0946 [Aciduliprofundum sp. MAR08-339]|nr:hypothetical protein AciM339_0946 [Aciduliprofundum sp. MAR08-339]